MSPRTKRHPTRRAHQSTREQVRFDNGRVSSYHEHSEARLRQEEPPRDSVKDSAWGFLRVRAQADGARHEPQVQPNTQIILTEDVAANTPMKPWSDFVA